MRFHYRNTLWLSHTLALALFSGFTLAGCKCSSTSPRPAATPGIPDAYVEDYYQAYLQFPEAKIGTGRGGHWARVATSMSPTMDPNKVSTKTALHYLGTPDFAKMDRHGSSIAYIYVVDTPSPHDEVLFVDFDDAGNVLQITFLNRDAVDFSGWRRWGATTQAVH